MSWNRSVQLGFAIVLVAAGVIAASRVAAA